MSHLVDPDPEIVRRTFRAELARSVTVGVMETALATFAILIAVRQYESGPTAKALILGSHAIGMIGSLVVVPLACRMNWKVTRLAAVIQLFGGAGFLFAALASDSEAGFVAGVCVGFICMGLPLPLQTQYWRRNIPDRRRGRMFSQAILVRAVATSGFSLLGGWLLGIQFEWFTSLLLIFAGASVMSAGCLWAIPAPELPAEAGQGTHIFHAMRWLKRDRIFRWVIGSTMVMGLGILTANSLRVDYLANPEHGLFFSPEKVGFVAGAVPAIMRVATTFFWGLLFDRVHFLWMRVAVSLTFGMAIVLYFSTGNFWMIVAGAALLGCARGGGEILWNLWVTKLSAPEHSAEYMSVHTFLTGVRAAAAPFLGFYIVAWTSIGVLMAISLGMVILSVLILAPFLKEATAGRRSSSDPGSD